MDGTRERDLGATDGVWAQMSSTQRSIVVALLSHGRMSRPDLMDAVGISPGSVTRLTTPLVEQGLLRTLTEKVADTGRPQSPLEVCAEAESLVGVVLTPTSMVAVLTDLRLRVLAHRRAPLPDHRPAAVVQVLSEAVASLRAAGRAGGAAEPTCLGISLGGSSPDCRTVEDAGFFGWHHVPLARMARERTGLPTVVGNDLVALSRLEAWFGAGRQISRLCVVTVGAGVGYGMVVDGNAISTPDSELGLLSTIPVPDGARPGVAVPAQDCLSSAALERAWVRHGHQRARAEEIVAMAAAGVPDAVAAGASYARRLGRLLGMVAALALPDQIVVAGEMADLPALLEDQVMVGVAAVRRQSAMPLNLTIREHDRLDWARGSAVLALAYRIEGAL